MRVTLAQIEAFVSVARLGTVHAAARQLNLAQPTVSLRLRDLERALGTRLFERQGRGLRLSQTGVLLQEQANRVIRDVAELKNGSGRGDVSGLVRLGVSETFAVLGLPSLLRRLAADYQDLRVELAIGSSPKLVRDVLEQRLDVVIVVNPLHDTRLRIVPFGIQPSTWAAAPSLGLPPVVRPADILHQTILMNPAPSPNHDQTTAWFGTAGMEPAHLSMCDTVPSVVAHLIEAGIGIAILPSKLIEPQIQAGKLLPLSARPTIPRAQLCAVSNASNRVPAIEAVRETTRSVLLFSDLLEPV